MDNGSTWDNFLFYVDVLSVRVSSGGVIPFSFIRDKS